MSDGEKLVWWLLETGVILLVGFVAGWGVAALFLGVPAS